MAPETTRLILLPWSPAQLRALIEQPERFEGLAGFPAADGLREFFVSGDPSPEWQASLRAASGPDPWHFGFLVVEREGRSAIGSAGFKGPPDSRGMVEIAYGIVPGMQGRGYATEAAGALVAYALETGGVRLIRAHTLPEANASTRVLLKCGFRHTDNVVDPDDGPVWRWERAVSRTRFECATPILRVANMARSLRYYVEVLGFTNAEWGGDDFTCVTRDSAAIYLSEGDQGQPETWVWVGVGDVDALYDEYKEKGATILHPPENLPWACEMKVGDPDGHVLRFGSEPKEPL